MQIRENISLKPYNTFGMDARAQYFATFADTDQLQALTKEKAVKDSSSLLVLGGGSNLLLTKDIAGTVLKNEVTGIKVIYDEGNEVLVQSGGGESWHGLVMFCVANGLAGMENLALIPGSVGASPIQNIGAYGVELKDVFHSLDAWHLKDGGPTSFAAADCAFGYRDSVFKRKYRQQFAITSVTFRLNRQPVFQTAYGALQAELDQMNLTELSINAVAQAVINIRTSKLPDPKEIGNAGSFFKNPAVDKSVYKQLQEVHPSIPSFPFGDDQVKIPAGWLIEQCGWKGYRKGDAGCYPKQALVLVNYGYATGSEIFELSEAIVQSVRQRFLIELEREVNIM